MHPPCEMMTDSFLPGMRRLVAKKLREEGFSQGRIASMMGVTQASVSLYLKSGRKPIKALESLGISPEQSALYASLLAEDLKKSPVYAVSTLYSVWSDALGRGGMCAAHRLLYPSLAQCDMCIKTFGAHGPAHAEDAIEHVAQAVRIVEASPSFVRVMPEVSVNIAYARAGASSTQDVVAVPGRIVRVHGSARSFMRPELGASTHVAAVLLAAKSRDGSISAAMNLRYDSKMARVLRRLRLSTLNLEESLGPRTDEEMLAQLLRRFREETEAVEAVVDAGGSGIEPSLYLFAADAVSLAQLALRIAREYSNES